jgi:hypothetical protein
MERSETWWECVRSVIESLVNSPSVAAQEVGKVWRWAFSRLQDRPDDFNLLQNPDVQLSLVKEFMTTCELRARGTKTSDRKIVEFTLDKSVPLTDAPSTAQISKEIADALSAFGMFIGHEGHNSIDSPGRFAYSTALFGFDKEVFKDILESKQIPEGQRKILEEVAKHMPKGKARQEYFRRCEAAANIERLFGFSKRLLTATDVYQRGLEFYKASSRLGPAVTLTFSNTSGLWNPLERYGTAEFIRRYGITSASSLVWKDGFRSTNFTDGILNPSLACRRLYLFNVSNTWKGFADARALARNQTAFDQEAMKLVEQVCTRMESVVGTLHLVSVKNWTDFPPLALVTRVSDNTIMFSNRGSDLSIAHAFWCCRSEREERVQRIKERSWDVLKALADMASAGLLTVFERTLPLLESLFGRIDYLRKASEKVAGERMRRLLDEEPAVILSELKDQFGLEVEYLTPAILRAQVEEAFKN